MCTGAMNLQQPSQQLSNLKDKESVLNVLTTEGYIEAARVDPILLTTLLEDLLIIPGSVNGENIFFPGPKLGLRHVPAYVFNNDNKKSSGMKLSDIIDKSSASAARNLILFDVFSKIEKVQQLINTEKYNEAYEIIHMIEHNLLLIGAYYQNETYGEYGEYGDIEIKITTLKRKIEIETNIFCIK